MTKTAIKPKLLFIVFLTSIIAMMISGFYALEINQRFTVSFEQKGKQFKVFTTAAAKVTSYAKRAEGHLFLYLMLHDPIDKEKYPKRLKSLHENISILRQISNSPQATPIVNKIIANAGKNLSIGNTLIAHHDQAMQEIGEFNFEAYRGIILKLHERFSQIRKLGVELTTFLITSEDNLKAEAYDKAMQLRFYLLIFIALAACFTVYTGYVFIKMISTLNKEIDVRIKSEHVLQTEKNKLSDALSEIKTLSGFIPICASCKKIRDDKGYWNQVETYISEHSDAKLSHSICPECAKKLYPEIYSKIEAS